MRVIYVDDEQPALDEITLAGELKKRDQNIRIFFMTAFRRRAKRNRLSWIWWNVICTGFWMEKQMI